MYEPSRTGKLAAHDRDAFEDAAQAVEAGLRACKAEAEQKHVSLQQVFQEKTAIGKGYALPCLPGLSVTHFCIAVLAHHLTDLAKPQQACVAFIIML